MRTLKKTLQLVVCAGIVAVFVSCGGGKTTPQVARVATPPPPPKKDGTTWKIEKCEVNEILDVRTCTLVGESLLDRTNRIGVVVGKGTTDRVKGDCDMVLVGFSHFPGEDILARVDDNAPINWQPETTCGSPVFKRLIGEMLRGTVFRAQFMTWPERDTYSKKLLLEGFKEAYDKTKRAATTGIIEN